jgi:hypothetical protein
MANKVILERDGGVIFTAKIVPGSSGPSRFCGVLDGMLKFRISAAPEKGKANKCLLDYLAGRLAVKKNSVSIVSGRTSPVKRVKVSGVTVGALTEKLGLNEQDFC